MSSSQVWPLVALRWRMVRTSRARLGFGLLAATVPVAAAWAVIAGQLLPAQRAFDVTLLAPSAYLSVAVIAVLAPLVTGGGNELFPDSQLLPLPIRHRTHHAVSLALTPLNIAWTVQLIGLVAVTAYIAARGPLVAVALVTCLLYVAAVTVLGHAVGWTVVGLRHSPWGRAATLGTAAALMVAGAALQATGSLSSVLDSSPTTYVVIAALNGSVGRFDSAWWLTHAGLVAVTAVLWFAGRRACAWALRQPGGSATTLDSRPVRRRRSGGSSEHLLLRKDRASLWRSAPLRRGLLVLGVMPGLVAAAAGLDWPTLVLLPALVAAGAGLLFGVNAFCLDGAGVTWLAAQPVRPAALFWSKARVVAETAATAIAITVAVASVRTGRWPEPGELAALLACSAVVLARVVAVCMTLSVRRPQRADLSGPRDTPAPPGVMAAYSTRLAVSTTFIALLFSGLAEVAPWTWSVALAVPFLLLSTRRVLMALRHWEQPPARAHVVTVVAAG